MMIYRKLILFCGIGIGFGINCPAFASSDCYQYLAAKNYIDAVREKEYQERHTKNLETLRQLQKFSGRWMPLSESRQFGESILQIRASEKRDSTPDSWISEHYVELQTSPRPEFIGLSFSPVNEGWQARTNYSGYDTWQPIPIPLLSKQQTIIRTSVTDDFITLEMIRREPGSLLFRGRTISRSLLRMKLKNNGSELAVSYDDGQNHSTALFIRIEN